nr:E3 ubiquitin-protein ligase TRIM32-like isoform X2 [Cherax quadricarinatus]
MDEHEVNCTVCMEPFEEERHSPRTLRCGHTLCTPCIEALLDRAHHDRLCPECRKPLKISAVGHIPVSYTILRLARALSSATSEPHIRVQVEDGETCLQHGAPIMSWCQKCNVWRCRECKCPKECTVFMNLPEALLHIKQAYVDCTNGNISRLADQKAIYEKKKSEIEKEMLALREKNKKIEENLKRFDASIDKLEEYEAQTVEASSSRRLDKVLGLTNSFLKDMETWLGDLKRSAESEKSSSLRVAPATVKVQAPVPKPEVPLTGPLDFASLKERLKVSQSMYAVQEKGGRTRWAKLSINEKNLLIHALDDIPPPIGATLLPLDSVTAGMSPNKPSAFLDVTIQQRLEGNVYMTMFGVTPRSQNFLLLCSGALGPCFKGLQLKSSDIGEGKPKLSIVLLGPFPNGQDCPPLVEGITDGGSYNSNIYPGLITGYPQIIQARPFR